MDMIQLQYRNFETNDTEGLYLNVDQIVSVRSDKKQCKILTTAGVEYLIMNPLSQVLDDIVKINVRRIEERKQCKH